MARKKQLPSLSPAQEKLGLPTIMDRALAQSHGVPYVHLAVFAIDVDRIRDAVEGFDDPRPFGWEVLLTEAYLLRRFEPRKHAHEVLLLEDTVLSILDGATDALGSQLVFAVWDALARGELPKELDRAFRGWRTRPKQLVKELGRLWADPANVPRLAASALEVEMEPPIAPPTREALENLAEA